MRICCLLLSVTLLLCLCGCVPANSFDTSNLGSVPQTTVPKTTGSAVLPQPKTLTVYQIGDSVELTLTEVQTTVAGMPLEYGWAIHNGNILVEKLAGDCHIGTIPGSERYIYAYVGSMTGLYFYFVDVQTGTVADPLSALEQDVRERILDVAFSPDGHYAVVISHSGTLASLLNCVTGEVTMLPFDAEIYSASAFFMDAGNLLLIPAYQDENGQIYFELCRYEIATGLCTAHPGRYQSKDRSKENFLSFSEDGTPYTFINGQLALFDPYTWEATAYPFGEDATVNYYTEDSYIVFSNGVCYLLRNDGAYQQISQ